MSFKTKALCDKESYIHTFYPDVKEAGECKKIFVCWDSSGDLDGTEKAACLSKLGY